MAHEFPREATHAKSELTVINLFGPPGIGKSSLKSGLFWHMKSRHESVEEIQEYAKYLTITDRTWQLREEQLYLFAKQHHSMFVLRGKYEYCITDSPLLLTAYYAPKDVTPPAFYDCVKQYDDTFNNINFFVNRDLSNLEEHFEEQGRWHKREDSIRIENEQREFLDKWGVSYVDISLNENAPAVIYEHLKALKLGNNPLASLDM